MGKKLVFGHKNPDTDALSAAVAMAYYLERIGEEAEAVALGKANDESKFAFDYFKVSLPRIVSSVADEVEEVVLVDHNEPIQSVDDLDQVTVIQVVDHHRIFGFNTGQPLYYRAEPIGSTSSVLYKMFQEKDIDIPQAIAGLMLSAIISDTLLLKSPTCTKEDIDIANELAKIAEVNLNEYGLELLKAGTNIASQSEDQILNGDAKNFEMDDQKIRVGQVNIIGFDEILDRKVALLAEMEKAVAQDDLSLFLFVATDVLDSNSIGLVAGNKASLAEKAFKQSLKEQQIDLPGVVSRKKQIIPPLTEAFTEE